MEQFLLEIDSGKNEKEYNRDVTRIIKEKRIAAKYSFYASEIYNPLQHDFELYLKNYPDKAYALSHKILDEIRNHYQKILYESKELLGIENIKLLNRSYIEIFNFILMFKDIITIQFDDIYKLELYNIKISEYNNHCYNKICNAAMKANIINIKNDQKYPLFIFIGNSYDQFHMEKKYTWYKKLWIRIKWKYLHHHQKDKIIFKEKEIYE